MRIRAQGGSPSHRHRTLSPPSPIAQVLEWAPFAGVPGGRVQVVNYGLRREGFPSCLATIEHAESLERLFTRMAQQQRRSVRLGQREEPARRGL